MIIWDVKTEEHIIKRRNKNFKLGPDFFLSSLAVVQVENNIKEAGDIVFLGTDCKIYIHISSMPSTIDPGAKIHYSLLLAVGLGDIPDNWWRKK